jgi:hypothetical protein
MRGTLAQEAVEAMQDARAAKIAATDIEPTDQEKIAAYQAATAAVMSAAGAGADHVEIEHAQHALLRYVGQALTNQGFRVNFDFQAGKLAARWG